MKIHRLEYRTVLPLSLDVAWEFFSNPGNLAKITPEEMDFRIISGAEQKAYSGQVIVYSVRPMWNIPLRWVTEITQCVEKAYFVDEQRFGPYRFWHHLHRFTDSPDGVVMEDILHYALPFGPVGRLMGRLFIHKKVGEIFTYREKVLEKLFKNDSTKRQ